MKSHNLFQNRLASATTSIRQSQTTDHSWTKTGKLLNKVCIHNFSVLPRRTDVNSVTNWNAPLVWEGTFDPVVIDAIYKKMDPRVAVVVFAVGK